MQRSEFIKFSLLGAAGLITSVACKNEIKSKQPALTKRDRMMKWLAGEVIKDHTPAAFFIHFDTDHKLGKAAAEEHIKYFRATNMDFAKIQYEQEMPKVDFIKKPTDWAKWTPPGIEFYQPQLEAVKGILKELKKEALVIMTLYSPFMSAGHAATKEVLISHLGENPDAVTIGLDRMVESQMQFVNECIKLGVDGFYMSTQGSETNQLTDPSIFTKYIKPTDLVAMKKAQSECIFNILHVCDYHAPYSTYDTVLDYPGHVVNCNPKTTNTTFTWQQIKNMFGRPVMGGIDRHGVINNDSMQEVYLEINQVLQQAPDQFILGADCTLPGTTDWKKIRSMIDKAHGV